MTDIYLEYTRNRLAQLFMSTEAQLRGKEEYWPIETYLAIIHLLIADLCALQSFPDPYHEWLDDIDTTWIEGAEDGS